MLENNTDKVKSWIVDLKNGSADAFDQLFQIYGKRLYHFALGYLKSKEDAEEIVQEVFLKIWNNHKNINPELSFQAYLFKIAYRQIMDVFRKMIREKAYLHEILETSLNFNDNLNEQTNYHSLLELLEVIIRKLPPRQNEIFTLRKIEGYSINEIAEKLGIAHKTIEHHFTQAQKIIKKDLEKQNIDGILFYYLFVKG